MEFPTLPNWASWVAFLVAVATAPTGVMYSWKMLANLFTSFSRKWARNRIASQAREYLWLDRMASNSSAVAAYVGSSILYAIYVCMGYALALTSMILLGFIGTVNAFRAEEIFNIDSIYNVWGENVAQSIFVFMLGVIFSTPLSTILTKAVRLKKIVRWAYYRRKKIETIKSLLVRSGVSEEASLSYINELLDVAMLGGATPPVIPKP
jgi:hypothetical protein